VPTNLACTLRTYGLPGQGTPASSVVRYLLVASAVFGALAMGQALDEGSLVSISHYFYHYLPHSPNGQMGVAVTKEAAAWTDVVAAYHQNTISIWRVAA